MSYNVNMFETKYPERTLCKHVDLLVGEFAITDDRNKIKYCPHCAWDVKNEDYGMFSKWHIILTEDEMIEWKLTSEHV